MSSQSSPISDLRCYIVKKQKGPLAFLMVTLQHRAHSNDTLKLMGNAAGLQYKPVINSVMSESEISLLTAL